MDLMENNYDLEFVSGEVFHDLTEQEMLDVFDSDVSRERGFLTLLIKSTKKTISLAVSSR